ncbi:ABC transporter ATP-binding protein [Paenibacillus sp. JJ-223]|uniref:ATP-binding cassette domain-containing protein n=1 Tax=Paenibacillus sp. JJ-223 TaxID=2905647 RepID=UPI001F4104E8|nr:ABC transporter ATP-binding protein [Paenibacillus sp. JJ-223]CAH1197055.1 Vitamin B12 import ATP-binding protein BtuD [Paenibacillus sp. JJ-223]
MIHVEQVEYGYQGTPVLKNLTLREDEPVISALWGRNGAGKTTLMSLLAGHQRPEQGTIRIMGHEPYDNLAAQENLCYVQENHPFGRNWSMVDLMRYGQYFHPEWDQELAERLVDMFELPLKRKIAKFSKGMKTAAQIILGLSSRANITILDEPTNGLDAEKRKFFYRALLETYEDQPRLMLLSSHHIEEIQPLCESLIVLHGGNILLHQSMEEMRERGILLTGDISAIERVAAGSPILESSRLGSTHKVMIDAVYSGAWKEKASEYGVTIEKAAIQDYLVNVTRKHEEVRP